MIHTNNKIKKIRNCMKMILLLISVILTGKNLSNTEKSNCNNGSV